MNEEFLTQLKLQNKLLAEISETLKVISRTLIMHEPPAPWGK